MLLVQVFGRVVDPENFAMRVYSGLNAWQVELADARIGCLRLFSPANPTGARTWLLAAICVACQGCSALTMTCAAALAGQT
jgi:hypothetical protein